MNEPLDDSKRHLVPRWLNRKDKETIRSSLPVTISNQDQGFMDSQDKDLLKSKRAWENNRGLGFAVDFISSSVGW